MACNTDETEWDLDCSVNLIEVRDREQNGWRYYKAGNTHALNLSVTSRDRATIKELYEAIQAILRSEKTI